MTRFAAEVAVVTGAGQRIGRAAALRLAREGASIVVIHRERPVVDGGQLTF